MAPPPRDARFAAMIARAMAAPPMQAAARWARRILGWLALAFGCYALAGWIGGHVPRNALWQEADREGPQRTIEIMIESNGVHTAIVMPRVTPERDWTRDFPAADVYDPWRPYTHVSVSWGERDVFLGTPTWADLSPLTVLRIVFAGGDGLLHVAHYVRPAPSANMRPVTLTPEEYMALVEQIDMVIPGVPAGTQRRRYHGYHDSDVFYPALGTYTAITTCNQWTSNTLAAAGVRVGSWTPFAPGVMRWFADPDGA